MKNKLPELYAQIHCDDSQILCTKLNYQKKVGYSQKNVNLYWISYILRTKSKILTDKPRKVRISTDSQCNSLTSPIPIQDDNPKKTYTFGVCLHKSIYDIKDPQILIDWIELYLVLGAEIFTIYFQDVPEIFYEIMKPYINEGLVEILEWKLKSTALSGTDVFWGQFLLINDCIYHNLYHVKYLALMDMDEFIIPQNKSYFKITDMLPTLQTLSPDAATYVFLHTNFLSDGVTLPEVNKSVKCSSMSWPRYCSVSIGLRTVIILMLCLCIYVLYINVTIRGHVRKERPRVLCFSAHDNLWLREILPNRTWWQRWLLFKLLRLKVFIYITQKTGLNGFAVSKDSGKHLAWLASQKRTK